VWYGCIWLVFVLSVCLWYSGVCWVGSPSSSVWSKCYLFSGVAFAVFRFCFPVFVMYLVWSFGVFTFVHFLVSGVRCVV
jgi:hypothetical protein